MELDNSFKNLFARDSIEFFVLFVNDFNDSKIEEFEKFARDHKKIIKFLLAVKNSNNDKIYKELRDAL